MGRHSERSVDLEVWEPMSSTNVASNTTYSRKEIDDPWTRLSKNSIQTPTTNWLAKYKHVVIWIISDQENTLYENKTLSCRQWLHWKYFSKDNVIDIIFIAQDSIPSKSLGN